MATYALVAGGGIVQMAAATFPVHAALTWTGDVSAMSPTPAVGWAATETNGTWSFVAPAAATTNLVAAAQSALEASDRVVIRCCEHAVAVPPEWMAYRVALRAIVAGIGAGNALPVRPAYPAGT